MERPQGGPRPARRRARAPARAQPATRPVSARRNYRHGPPARAAARAQPADLPLEIRAGGGEAAVLVDEAVPHVDIDDAGLLGAAAIEVVEINHFGGRTGAADRRQADPEHRRALGLERRDRVVD